MAVKSQLIEEFALDENKIILPIKNQLKNELPFFNENSINLARNIIKGLNQLATAQGNPLGVDFGTLLVRDKDLISWDDDDVTACLTIYCYLHLLLAKRGSW
ncbi:MAG: hypothetical protein ABJH28_08910 [Paraglaciecola sp.]|uniref:hypothetical protein n=1 Tax=Paraglaciecola sp. TaxID=1920173 RepID=UPI003262F0AA